jgi:N utilization substance protein A
VDVDMTALKQLERDKEISMDVLIEALREALLNAYEKTPGAIPGARVEVDRKTGKVSVYAPELDEEGNRIGEFDHTPEGFGRVAAATARQVIFQRLREAEDEQKFGHFAGVEGDIVLGVVQQDRDSRTVRVDLGSIEAIMPHAEQVPGEDYSHGKRLRVYVVSVRRELHGPQVVVSRTHPNLVAKLFRMEVPEIEHGVVEIKAIAREAGHRDIIDYSDDPASFVAQALSPAKVTSVTVTDATARAARVIVPDYQLSLAIGREGQNARLAARLTGWRIDIRPDTETPTAS